MSPVTNSRFALVTRDYYIAAIYINNTKINFVGYATLNSK